MDNLHAEDYEKLDLVDKKIKEQLKQYQSALSLSMVKKALYDQFKEDVKTVIDESTELHELLKDYPDKAIEALQTQNNELLSLLTLQRDRAMILQQLTINVNTVTDFQTEVMMQTHLKIKKRNASGASALKEIKAGKEQEAVNIVKKYASKFPHELNKKYCKTGTITRLDFEIKDHLGVSLTTARNYRRSALKTLEFPFKATKN